MSTEDLVLDFSQAVCAQSVRAFIQTTNMMDNAVLTECSRAKSSENMSSLPSEQENILPVKQENISLLSLEQENISPLPLEQDLKKPFRRTARCDNF